MASHRESKDIYLHHEQIKSFQDKFCQHVVSLVSVMEELENPFLENDETLVCLDTKDMAENIVFDTEKLDRVSGKTKISGTLH